MKFSMKNLMKFREVIFWQQLNKQMIELKEKGRLISEENQDALQKFCFQSKLFERITEDPLLDDIPMALITDFSRINLLTINAASWNDCLERLFPGAAILNIERALADAFDVITDYDRRRNLFKSEPDEDDEELYDFISRYNSILPEEHRDLNSLLQDLYGFKAEALSQIFILGEIPKTIRFENQQMIFDLKTLDKGQEIIRIYDDLFCSKSMARVEGITVATTTLKDMEVLDMFDKAEREPDLKPSVINFILYERDLYLRKQKLLGEFHRLLTEMKHPRHDPYIRICHLAPFAFLKSLFPLV